MSTKLLTILHAALLGMVLCPASTTHAAVVVDYTTAGSVTSIAPGTVAPGVTGIDLTAGSGLNSQTFSTFNFTGWDTASTTFADAVAANDFWSWGFTANPLTTVELTTMDIRLDRSGTGPDDFEIQASVNGGSPLSLLTHDFQGSSSGVTFADVDISGLGTITGGDTVAFTLAAFNSDSDGGSFDLESIGGGAGLVINGTITAVPEPSSMAVLAVLTAGAAVSYRRRASKKA